MTLRALLFPLFLSLPLLSQALLARSLLHERFHADIEVFPGGEIRVTETLRTRFTGSWNGILRFIPVSYRSPHGFSYKLRLELEDIGDGQGRPLRHETYRERHYQVFKIWVPDAQDATRTVVIRYRVGRALRFQEEYDELYWNVTGDEGAVPIEKASTRIQLPSGAGGVRAAAFTGAYGSTEQAARVDVSREVVAVETLRSLNIREGLTVAVVWDPGLIHRPTALERAGLFWSDNWIFTIPLLAFALMFRVWHTRGRDPRRRPIAPQYAPPDEMTPAEMGTLLDNQPDLRDITATLVDLAVRGYLRIEETEKELLLGLWSKTDYQFVMRKDRSEWAPLKPHERALLRALFAPESEDRSDPESRSSEGGTAVALSDLQNEFYKDLPTIRDRIFDQLIKRRFYGRRPDKLQRICLMAAVAIAGVMVTLGVSAAALLGQAPLAVIVAGLLTGGAVAFFGWLMPVRTIAGTRFLERILGFEEFLKRVESDRFKRMITGPEMFEQFLPHAMALGVEKSWAAAFADLYKEPPDWYRGSDFEGFHTRGFVSSLNQMSTRAAAVMASSPRSSGGSGFGGGGGSSGGGFGGGGTSGF